MLTHIIIFGKAVPMYGVCMLFGAIVLLIMIHFRCEKSGLNYFDTVWFCYASFLGMILGAILLGIVSQLPQIYEKPFNTIITHFVKKCPIVFYGGLLGAIAGGSLYAKMRHIDLKTYFNAVIPSYPLFHAFGRIGCFFGGCCYGVPCSWGIIMGSNSEHKASSYTAY